MRAGHSVWPLFVFLLLFPIVPLAASAATLQGTIRDPDGAVVPGAMVRLLNPQGAEVAHTVSDERGHFRFPKLASGTYTIKASLSGFGEATLKARDGENVRLVLPLAPIHERVVVTATRTAAA